MFRNLFLIVFAAFIVCACGPEDTSMDDYESQLGVGQPFQREQSAEGWSVAGQLDARTTVKKVTLQANFPKPGTYTVQLNANPFAVGPLDPNAKAPEAEALITWSVEGNSIQRRVSVISGMAISGAGQGVKVEMVNVSIPSPALGPTAEVMYPVSAQVVLGSRGTDSNPPYLCRSAEVQGMPVTAFTQSAIVNVPQGVGVKSVQSLAALNDAAFVSPAGDNGALVVEMLSTAGTVLAVYDPRFYNFIPLAPGTVKIRYRSMITVAGANWLITPMWGIEG